MYPKCLWCEKELINGWKPMRSGASFCSDACRTKYHNAKKRIVRASQTITLAIHEVEKLLIKQGELGDLALSTLRSVQVSAKVSSVYQCYCKSCGQTRLFFPMVHEKCDFCKNVAWGFKLSEGSNINLQESGE